MSKDRSGQRDDLLVWIDLETTGLKPELDPIVEIVVVITDYQLNVVATLDSIIIHAEREKFARVPFVLDMHTRSGLVEQSVASTVSMAEAEARVIGFLQEHVVKQSSPLCGSSIYMDRMFLRAHMPLIDEYLHYRLIDVSTIKELTRRWYPHVYGYIQQMKVTKAHRAHDDILDSIKELKVYKDTFFHSASLPTDSAGLA